MATLRRHTAARWDDLIDGLTAWVRDLGLGVLDRARVIVPSPAVGRLAGQALAGRLGILAGISFVTPQEWRSERERNLGDGESSPWRGRALHLAVWEALQDPDLRDAHRALAAHLAEGRILEASRRIARVLAALVEHRLDLVAGWLGDPDPVGLPEHLAWLPELFVRVSELLEWDPVEEFERLRSELPQLEDLPTAMLLCPDLSPTTELLLAAGATDVVDFELDGTARPTSVTWLGSHGPERQVELVRDELCHLLASCPDLEPRDIVLIVDDPAAWWPALTAALAPSSGGPAQPHPGRSLRLQRPPAAREPNPVLALVAEVARLATSRVEASTVLDLLSRAPLRHRWSLPERPELAELLARAGVRWGLDAQHRAAHGLPGVTQNTLARGLDRLLAGITLAPDSLALPIAGAEGVTSPQLEVIGALTELYSRLRRHSLDSEAATVPAWVQRSLGLITGTMSLPRDEEWLLEEATTRLATLARETALSPVVVTAAQFARLVDELVARPSARPVVGSGGMTVATPQEVPGAGFKVVALLGLDDPPAAAVPDVPDPTQLPDAAEARFAALLASARGADHLIVAQQARSSVTGDPLEAPTVLDRLARSLDVSLEVRQGTATPHAAANFRPPRPSFDQHALAAARVQADRDVGAPTACTRRRRAVLDLPELPSPPRVTVEEVARFLKDPALAFLRERAGIRPLTPEEPADDLTLTVSGLDAWAVRSRLLAAARAGEAPWDAARTEQRREQLPIGQLGRSALEADLELVGSLWLQARDDWEAPVTDHPVSVQVGATRLVGQVRLRGDQIVVLTPSQPPGPLFEPWVQLLALAASGRPTRARIHHLRQDFGRSHAQVTTLDPPSNAAEVLGWLVRGTVLSRSRLVPVPAAPARELVQGVRTGRPAPEAWSRPVDAYDSPWAWRPAHWEHFYDQTADQLWEDRPRPEDPPGDDRFGSFGRWAFALHAPLLEATR